MSPVAAAEQLLAQRLCIGTVQLGMRYGVANRTGLPDAYTILELIKLCNKNKINCFDTAEAYGESETVLGITFASLGLSQCVQVVSKGTLCNLSLRKTITGSLNRIGVARLHAWMLHDQQQLDLWNLARAEEAAQLHADGLVERFGLSCYHPEFALRGVEEMGLKVVQFPGNPFDRRFLRNRVLDRIAATGAWVFVRSIYLQGLCLLPLNEVPGRIPDAQAAVLRLSDFCQQNDLTRDAFCFHYILAKTQAAGARLVVGLETPSQLLRTCELVAMQPPPAALFDTWDELWPHDLNELILPSLWPATAAKSYKI